MVKKNFGKNLLLIDKPKGISSFEVIRILRKKLKIKKIGHAGTLDPLASGLLILGIEKGTKKLNKFLKLPKVYHVEILFGKETTTGDLEGKVIKEKEIKKIEIKKIKEILKELTGKIILPVPLYSAVKISGTPLYKLARKGEKVKPKKKEMKVYYFKILDHWPKGKYYILKLEMKVKSGTYVRSIVEEIGKKLNLPTTVKELRRIKIGNFKVTQARTLKNIDKKV